MNYEKIEKIKEQYRRLHKTYIQTISMPKTDAFETKYESMLSTKLDTYELILRTLDIDSDEILEGGK
jgi:hypothetical protein